MPLWVVWSWCCKKAKKYIAIYFSHKSFSPEKSFMPSEYIYLLMNQHVMFRENNEFQKYATTTYDPIKIGSIDGTDTEPHDHAILRAIHSDYMPNKQVKGDPNHTIFVARLNPRTTQDTIHTEFSKFGKILNCRLVKDIVTGKSKQYAFVEYASLSSVDQALREMYKEYVEGAEIIVEREAERRLQGWKPRRLGGGFGGKKESGQLRFGCSDRPFRRPLVAPSKRDKMSISEKKT